MKKGTVVINPYVSKTYNGKPNPLYATAYLSPHKTIDRNREIHKWHDDVRSWQVIGFIDLSLEHKFDKILGEKRMIKTKEMQYTKECKREWLMNETYRGIEFVIMSLGTHPTAYIGITKGNKYYGVEDITDIYLENCHGGITYSDKYILNEAGEKYGIDRWWLGWDYAHSGDYAGFYPEDNYGKKWTTIEIFNDVKNTIDEILGEQE